MFKTLPRQLFLYLVPSMLLVLAIAGAYLDRLVDDQLVAYFDTTLDARARSIVALTEQDEDGVELEIYDVALPFFSREIDPEYFHIVDSSGETLFASSSAEGFTEQLPSSDFSVTQVMNARLSTQNAGASASYFFDHALPDGRSGRWIAVSFYPRIDADDDEDEYEPDGNAIDGNRFGVGQQSERISFTGKPDENIADNTLSGSEATDLQLVSDGLVLVNGVLISPQRVTSYVGASRSALDQLVWSIDIILLLTGIAIAAAIVLIAGFGIRRAITPLDQLGHDIAALDEQSLDSRITLSKPIAELDVLVNHFNQLLERLRTAFSRERQFSADVAHELRTPITEMRSLIEVQARFPENKQLSATYSSDLLQSTERMQHTVEQLMLLSKTEHGSLDTGEVFDLVTLVRESIASHQATAAERDLSITFNSDKGVLVVHGSRVWKMIISNVLDNAIDHSITPGSISCNLNVLQNSYSLTVSNLSDELEDEDLTFLCNRLWRKDIARTDGSHSGLGLALVSAYAKGLDLEVAFSLDAPADTEIQSRLFSVVFTGTLSANTVLK